MRYKHFYLAVITRLVIIILLSITSTYLFFEQNAYFTSIVILVFVVFTSINLISYFNKINKWISFFLLGIENEDTSLRIPSKTGNKAIDDVFKGMYKLNDLFKQTKIEIITQDQYFKMVINQSATGLFSINEKGRVININPTATVLTDLQKHHHINSLNKIDIALPNFIQQPKYKKSHQSAIFENKYGQKLLFKLSELNTVNEKIILIAVSDITKELDNREVDAWIKLARTLSHEIMNNIAPITSLSQVILGYFTKDNKTIELAKIDLKTITNTIKGLNVIEERSLALMNFVKNYRKFTKLPEPKFSEVNLSALIESNLLAANAFPGFDTFKIDKSVPKNVLVSTDEKLLSQVIINLLKNACEALVFGNTENPKLRLQLKQAENTISIEIANNGPGIPPEIKEQIFIPFFTTKDEGTGIGLSLSKQIMLKMGGDVLLYTTKEKLTLFVVTLSF